jgi:hypothetical protein
LFWILISGEVCVASDAFATVGVFFQVTVCLLSRGDSMQRKWMSNIVQVRSW